jgi:hypothetical protein
MKRIILLAVLLLPAISINANPKYKVANTVAKMVAGSAGAYVSIKLIAFSLLNAYKPANNKFEMARAKTWPIRR